MYSRVNQVYRVDCCFIITGYSRYFIEINYPSARVSINARNVGNKRSSWYCLFKAVTTHRGGGMGKYDWCARRVSGHGVTYAAAETVKGNRDAGSGRQCASREIKLIGKKQFLREVLRQCYGRWPSESILYSSRHPRCNAAESGLASPPTIARPRAYALH